MNQYKCVMILVEIVIATARTLSENMVHRRPWQSNLFFHTKEISVRILDSIPHNDEHQVRCYLIPVWRRGVSGKHVPNTYLSGVCGERVD